MTVLRTTLAGLTRNPARALVRIATLATAVALLGAMLVFVAHSLRTTTANAVSTVPIAWQGPVGSYAAAQRISADVARQPGVATALPAATAPFAEAVHQGSSGLIRTGRGSILAVPPDYATKMPTLRILHGSLAAGGVVLDQQLAATLQATIGDQVSLTPVKGRPATSYRVTGVGLVSAPDRVFAPLDPRAGPAPAQPPAQIAIMPIATFASSYAPALGSVDQATIGSNAVPGAQSGVQWQVQTRIAPSALHGDPSAALQQATTLRNRVERSLPGQVQFVDNLAETLTGAAGDALYAEALYILLAVPGALVALGLAYLAALGTAEQDRRDLALLRARGARRRDLLFVAAIESAILGAVSGLIGGGAALAIVPRIVAGPVGLTPLRAAATLGACVALATAGALAARLGAGIRVLRGEIQEQRVASVAATRRPLWQKLWLDVAAIAGSVLVYWLTLRTGFSAVVSPDSNPTLSLSFYMLLAPALLWIGVTLVLVRLRGSGIAWLARRGARTADGNLRGFLLASAARRGTAINRGLVLVGLLLAFGVQLGVFATTYQQQARVDAQLTLGADVAVTTPPGRAAQIAPRVAAVPGVATTSLVDHSYAYVGPDLQDTYGIDASSISRATRLRDSYFLGGSADGLMRKLAETKDGILVSKETVTDYGLAIGDLVKLRVLDQRSGNFVVTPFHVVGIVQEFPSAPKDSFMVTNRTYLDQVTHSPGPNVLFARVDGSPTAAGARIAAATAGSGAMVANIDQQTKQTVSSITTVDLTGISRIEQLFAILLAAAALGLLVHVALAERRRELATMAAIGAPLRDIAAFLWSEAAIVLAAGLALASGLGIVLAEMLTAMLTHVFDPPPDHLAIPWTYLGLLAAAAIGAAVIATGLAAARLRRLPLGSVLREQ